MQNAVTEGGARRILSALLGSPGLIREGRKLVNCWPILTGADPPPCRTIADVRKTFTSARAHASWVNWR
jgi:hypothetical protein